MCGDAPLIQQIHEQVQGSPLLVTSTDGFHVCSTFKRDFQRELWRGEFKCWTEALGFCPHALDWVMFTATAGLIWAAFSGATQIDVFGCDRMGTADFDGMQAGKNRSVERWQLEENIWERRLVPWLAERGVKVNRIAA